MKHKFSIAIIALACSLMFLAFTSKPFAYSLSAIDMTGKTKTKLEQSLALLQTKGKTSQTSSTYNISNAKSAIRLKISETVFRSSSDKSTLTMNPADYISLYKLTIGKTNRSFTMNTDGSANAALVPLVFSAEDYGFYKIGPANGLIAGEYAFVDKSTTTTEGNITVWTFGID